MILGEDYWKKVAAQRVTMQVKYDMVVSQVAFGEKPVAMFPAYSQLVNAIQAGAPVQIVHLKEGTTYYLSGVTFIKSAPHPNAALVFLNWMLSREGQTAIGKAAKTFSVRKDLNEDWLGIPELNLGTFKLLVPPNNVDPQTSPKGAEFGKKIFGIQ